MDMDFLTFLSYIILALLDLIVLEIILSLIFEIDDRGNIRYVFKKFFRKKEKGSIWTYIITLIALGIAYFFFANSYQDAIVDFFINYFGYYLLLLLISVASLVIFWIAKFFIGMKIKSPIVLVPLLAFIISTIDLIIVLIIR